MFIRAYLARFFSNLSKQLNSEYNLIIDESIPFDKVRVLKDKKLLGDFGLEEAITKAKSYGLSLILFKAKTTPPICVIDSVDSFNEKNLKESQTSEFAFDPCLRIKQIHISNTCSDADFKRKIEQAKKFLMDGNRVDISLVTKGGPLSISKTRKSNDKMYPTKIHAEAEDNIIKNASKLASIAKDKGMDLAYSTENPLILRIDKIYSLLQPVGKPFTLQSKIVSSLANQRQIVIKIFPKTARQD